MGSDDSATDWIDALTSTDATTAAIGSMNLCMKRWLRIAVLALAVMFGSPVGAPADEFDDAFKVYEAGDYEAAVHSLHDGSGPRCVPG